jgi:ABC-type glutathione transport system ATPase component
MDSPILQLKNISKHYPIESGFFRRQSGVVKALENVSFTVDEFSVLGVIGESGSGKTTLARVIVDLTKPTSGELLFDRQKITDFRRHVSIIFQNPYASLDPKTKIYGLVAEPLIIHKVIPKKEVRKRTIELLKMVGLDESALNRYPAEFSGGQRQRICIARALAANPKLVILDEPISSLDLTVSAKILDLFVKLKGSLKLTYIFISHNMAVIKHMADKVIVLKNGSIVESGDTVKIFNSPSHPYTRLLLSSVV